VESAEGYINTMINRERKSGKRGEGDNNSMVFMKHQDGKDSAKESRE
tara:strand:- start:455 stop:595 length:141 start_codon:yes stop_codon:yes gene_type:complete